MKEDSGFWISNAQLAFPGAFEFSHLDDMDMSWTAHISCLIVLHILFWACLKIAHNL